jgi:hypothetical protein
MMSCELAACSRCCSQTIDRSTGLGCSGSAMDVFGSDLTCCNWLNRQGGGVQPTDLCSRVNLDGNFTQAGSLRALSMTQELRSE